jgi:hypothetical protein
VVVAVTMVDDGVSQRDAGATVYETNYLGTSYLDNGQDYENFVVLFWLTVQQLFSWIFLLDA